MLIRALRISNASRNKDGSLRAHSRISSAEQKLRGPLDDFDEFGTALACLGTNPVTGQTLVAVGTPGDDEGGAGRGAVSMLSLGSLRPARRWD